MNRAEYMDQLRLALAGLQTTEINDICCDFEEHFEIGLSEVSRIGYLTELGSPKEVAITYLNRDDKVIAVSEESSPFNSSQAANS